MNLKNLLRIFSDHKCQKVYVKTLAPNDNSKNQVYLGGSFEVLNVLPIQSITSHSAGQWKRNRFKTKLDFSWVNDEGVLSPAPESQLILYPKYPEVRFSGFLKGCLNPPSEMMRSREPGRLLFMAISTAGRVIGYVASSGSEIAKQLRESEDIPEVGVFREITVDDATIKTDGKGRLLQELKRIHLLGWIDAKRFSSTNGILPCISSNCGGYTLEAELGISSNGFSEPDFMGWEVKQFAVSSFNRFQSKVITLMTPEPTHGIYAENGVEYFIRKYGYDDKKGRAARINFGGIHVYEKAHPTTSLRLVVEGFDIESGKIVNTDGFIGLLDPADNIAASWSFASLIKHWNTKHNKACYVPSMKRKGEQFIFSKQQYCYGNNVMLGSSTDFLLFLKQVCEGVVYYDPGIKLEFETEGRRKNIKRRSQFRIKSAHLRTLYKKNEIVDLKKI